MYNQGSDQEKTDMASGTPYIPPHSSQLPPDYTSQPGGYPPQPGGYPPQSGGYPPQSGGYPLQPSGYPPAPIQQQPMHTSHNTTNTTVVIQQQPAAIVVQQPRGWSSGLCACFDDCGVCLLGLCSCMWGLPIIECNVSGQAGECCCVGILCPIALRTKIRTRHNIQGSIVDDCCALVFCHYCAFCQMARELNVHGM